MKIVFLTRFEDDGRFTMAICEGLLSHPDVEVSFLQPFISFGRKVASAIPTDKLWGELKEAGLIFLKTLAYRDKRFFDRWDIIRFLESNNLWNKVVYLDHNDPSSLDYEVLDKCLIYVKRSWPIGSERKPREETGVLHPINYCTLNAYIKLFDAPSFRDEDRPINMGCFFHPYNLERPSICRRRANLLEVLLEEKKNFPSPCAIGECTNTNWGGHRTSMSIYEPINENHLWANYIKQLHKCKIIFTASPHFHDGGNRLWEALSSGALVFMSKSEIPTPRWFESGKHCFIYDALDKDSIREAVGIAKEYLGKPKERWSIAKAGYEHMLKYHMPINRIQQILDWVKER